MIQYVCMMAIRRLSRETFENIVKKRLFVRIRTYEKRVTGEQPLKEGPLAVYVQRCTSK
jgi:hypothetical protein